MLVSVTVTLTGSALVTTAVVLTSSQPVAASAAHGLRVSSPVADAARATLETLRGMGDDPVVDGRPNARRPRSDEDIAEARRAMASVVADAVVSDAGAVDAAALDAAWAAMGRGRLGVVATALAQVGVRYRYAASDPTEGFDCSGLTEYAWASGGLALPHDAYTQLTGAARRGLEAAVPGDLVGYPGHVMLYLGLGNLVVHAPYTGRTVEVMALPWTPSRFTDPTEPTA